MPVAYEIEVDKKSGNRTIKLIIKSEADNGADGGGKETDTLKIGGFGTITGKVAGYGKIVFDKKGNVIESGFGLSSEVNWEAHKSWCIATPIGPIYFTVGAEAKGNGEMTTKYDIEKEKWDDLSGKYTIGGGLFLEGGYGEPDIASVGVKGSMGLEWQIYPWTKAKAKAEASLHCYLFYFVDVEVKLAATEKLLWNTTGDDENSENGDNQGVQT